jgi:hypothetical protein
MLNVHESVVRVLNILKLRIFTKIYSISPKCKFFQINKSLCSWNGIGNQYFSDNQRALKESAKKITIVRGNLPILPLVGALPDLVNNDSIPPLFIITCPGFAVVVDCLECAH